MECLKDRNMIDELLNKLGNERIALYGLGTETKRFLADHGDKLSVVGLLDGFRTDGEMYGYPIIPFEETIEKGVKHIIVVARPGSCKAIKKRIGGFCEQSGIELYDVRGNDLLAPVNVAYDFTLIDGGSMSELRRKIKEAEVVSFDLFDTLLARKVYQYTDVFELVEVWLKEKGVIIPNLAKLRLYAEKELSKARSPKLIEIYDEVLRTAGVDTVSAEEFCDIEWSIDTSVMTPRKKVLEVFFEAVESGKDVVITSDCYYSKEQIEKTLEKLGIFGYKELFVSSEYDTLKTQHLFDELIKKLPGKRIIHIGDDETADIKSAEERGINTFKLYAGTRLYDALGGLGLEEYMSSLSDRIKVGLFISRIFNSPFVFEDSGRRLCVDCAEDFGYLFCAPMITDFVHWMRGRIKDDGIGEILFGARDGYLLQKLYVMLGSNESPFYFYTSRTASIRAGMRTESDIDYVDSMRYSGTPEEALRVRFGIDVPNVDSVDRNALILEKAEHQRENYRKYIEKLGIKGGDLAFFDFVAKGTTQMYLHKLFSQHMKGYYFLQLEPEFMADKGLDIEPFYSDEEKDKSAIFDNYYILETVLTAPHPQIEEMDDNGNPVFVKETRSEKDLAVFDRMQSGIIDYFEDYIHILPDSVRENNKKLDEMLLALVNRVKILDEDFLSIRVEDPFFGRMTDIKDVLTVE